MGRASVGGYKFLDVLLFGFVTGLRCGQGRF